MWKSTQRYIFCITVYIIPVPFLIFKKVCRKDTYAKNNECVFPTKMSRKDDHIIDSFQPINPNVMSDYEVFI